MSERHSQNGSSQADGEIPAEVLTAFALNQLEGAEQTEIARRLNEPGRDDGRQAVAETQRLAGVLPQALAGSDDGTPRVPEVRAAVLAHLDSQPPAAGAEKVEVASRRRWLGLNWIEWAAVGGLACLLASFFLPAVQTPRQTARGITNQVRRARAELASSSSKDGHTTVQLPTFAFPTDPPSTTSSRPGNGGTTGPQTAGQPWYGDRTDGEAGGPASLATGATTSPQAEVASVELSKLEQQRQSVAASGFIPAGKGKPGGDAGLHGRSTFQGVADDGGQGQPGTLDAFNNPTVTLHNGQSGNQKKYYDSNQDGGVRADFDALTDLITTTTHPQTWYERGEGKFDRASIVPGGQSGEQYEPITENLFLAPRQNPLSTFSIDVDTASYANMRRFLTGGSLPPPSAVRIEELVNYFRYDYPQPKGPEPFSVNMEVAECPWAGGHLLLRVGLKGKDVHRGERPASNLVFLLDVSGSMADENKLPLLKTAMQMFTRELGENDRVSIVTYAGEAGLRLPPTRGHEQTKILAAIESLSSGGSTNGSAGIDLAYEQAKAYFVEGGTNRVILCTDGDLNVGITDDDALVQLIKQKAAGGTFLTVLGFGTGNLKDGKMEKLADNGNGLYAYIDSVREARKVLVEQMTGSTITIAKDVKIQIKFNPAAIASYRLLGYENRVLAAQDFNDDKKDAGEIGAGHTVTALYELVPVGAKPDAAAPQPGVEPLKYQAAGDREQGTGNRGQEAAATLTDAAKSGELLTLKLRYKEPEGQASKLIEVPLKDRGGKFNGASKDLQFAAAVASFGMILRGSEHKGSSNIAAVEEIASGAIGEDAGGYRAEFVDLVRKAHSLGAR